MVCVTKYISTQTASRVKVDLMDRNKQMTMATIAYGATVGLVGWLASNSVAAVAAIGAVIVGLGWAFYVPGDKAV